MERIQYLTSQVMMTFGFILDGVLVLDMGGDHKMSQGCIDFTTLKSYVNNIDTTYQGSDLVYKNDTSKSGLWLFS